jgi:CheY-like chemotaxis protein
METALQALVVCSDERAVRVLRRVLSEMDIDIHHCAEVDDAIQKLTRRRFQAVVVDCTTPAVAKQILRGTQSALGNKRAVTVAVLEAEAARGQADLKDAFEHGAHFVLFKPISLERARANFHAVRALMKRERRRYARIPMELEAHLQLDGDRGNQTVLTADLGENGMAVKLPGQKLPPSFRVRLTLPGTRGEVECGGEVAWEGSSLVGIRFRDVAHAASDQLRRWVSYQLTGEEEEPSLCAKLTDLSICACYLETESPFPLRARLALTMRAGEVVLELEGVVRVLHPEAGMGIEFTDDTPAQRAKIEEFIQTLVNTAEATPNVEVKAEAIDNTAVFPLGEASGEHPDPLLALFLTKWDLPPELFRAELRNQRRAPDEVEI